MAVNLYINMEPLTTHLKGREGILQTHTGASPCIVTACGWVNPPKERVVLEKSESTCPHCLERSSVAV